MIAFDPEMTILFNVGINIFSGIITLIIFYNFKRNFADAHDTRMLRKIHAITFLILFTDIVAWALNGKSGTLVRVVNYANIMIYFNMQIIVAAQWLRYAHYRIFGRNIERKKEMLSVLIPFALLSMLVVTSPFNGLCFYLDDANYFHRGVLSLPMSVVILLYLLSVSVMALIQYKKETLPDRKKELLTIAFFVIPPFVGGVAQTVFSGMSMVWPCAVISGLLVMIDKESRLISQDSLTGLNNRRNMEKYLITYEDGQNRPLTLILLDVNDFKHINDQFGHSLGDVALMRVANILRETFKGTSAFLARYGGDEFVVIMPQGEEGGARDAVQKIKNNFDAFNKAQHLPFRLSVSIGYAISLKKEANRIADLLKEADANMYLDKARYHREENRQRIPLM